MNVLLDIKNYYLQNHGLPFAQCKVEDFIPALKSSIETALENIESYKEDTQISYGAIVARLEEINDEIDLISSMFFTLNGAHSTQEIEDIAPEISTMLSSYSSAISLDEKIFARIKLAYENQKDWNLSFEETRILETTYKSFVRNGALLESSDKETLRQIDNDLGQLSVKFSSNVLKATNHYFLHITEEKELEGIPERVKNGYLEEGKRRNLEGYVITLQAPSFTPFMQYAQNRERREELYKGYLGRCQEGDWENFSVLNDILHLRQKRASLLGYKSHADFVLENRMAKKPETVTHFLQEIKKYAKPFAQKEFEHLKELFHQDFPDQEMKQWDTTYYTEKLKLKVLSYNEEELKPYFSMEKSIQGVFDLAQKLYGLTFNEVNHLSVYHPDVKAYEVKEANGELLGYFMGDFYVRESKKPGAWMSDIIAQGILFGEKRPPLISIVCNFEKPQQNEPSLLTLRDVETLFHEFGHALHGLLSKTTYRYFSGPNVHWDFVELPSQILENWVSEKECLDLFAAHYQSGEKIPASLIEKIVSARSFMEGLATLRQLNLATLDLKLHSDNVADTKNLEKKVNQEFSFFPESNFLIAPTFSHLFAGGYSAGYYSYKWAEVLEADAFNEFKKNGLFDKSTSQKFRTLLALGGTKDPEELYKEFRGDLPSVLPLMKRAGFL